jgi:hypothetical protein
VVIVDTLKTGKVEFYVAPPKELERIVVKAGRALAKKPKKNGEPRKVSFRKEAPRKLLAPYLNQWEQLGEPAS